MTSSDTVVPASVFEQARAAKAAKPKPELTETDLKPGRVFRAKRPAKAGDVSAPCYNDRIIMWMGGAAVQYDGPAVAAGRRYPKVSVEAFLQWASHDVTAELPDGSYQPWPNA